MNILFFGDSNTWGANPNGGRLSRDLRFTGRIQMLLQHDTVIENGVCGRTTVFEDPCVPHRRGIDDLFSLLMAHQPLDLVAVMLGTNDVKDYFNASPCLIQRGLEAVVRVVLNHPYEIGFPIPQLLLISPPPIGNLLENCPYIGYSSESVRKSLELPTLYAELAEKYHTLFLDAGRFIQTGQDQIHLSPESHETLANALCTIIEKFKKGCDKSDNRQ